MKFSSCISNIIIQFYSWRNPFSTSTRSGSNFWKISNTFFNWYSTYTTYMSEIILAIKCMFLLCNISTAILHLKLWRFRSRRRSLSAFHTATVSKLRWFSLILCSFPIDFQIRRARTWHGKRQWSEGIFVFRRRIINNNYPTCALCL